jgi:hypothetical protein
VNEKKKGKREMEKDRKKIGQESDISGPICF